MLPLVLYMLSLGSPVHASRCEESGPRLDGTYVTICDGEVTRIRDDRGNVREVDRATGDITVRSADGRILVLTNE